MGCLKERRTLSNDNTPLIPKNQNYKLYFGSAGDRKLKQTLESELNFGFRLFNVQANQLLAVVIGLILY